MVDTKKTAAKPEGAITAAKPTTNTATRPSLPSLSPLPDAKPAPPAAVSTASEKANQPVSAELQPTATPAKAAKPTETLAPKLRAKSEILSALRAGSHAMHTEAGLYRIIEVGGTVHPASKRRILALIEQGVLKPTESDKRKYVLDAEADKKAEAPKPPASAPAPAKSEPSASTKQGETK